MRLWNTIARIAFIGTAVVSLSSVAHAGKFGVRVLDANTGLPVANASVCLGTAADRNKYGTGITSYSGVALYDDVPSLSVLITVSKKNYRGIALRNPATSDNVIADVVVTEGNGKPTHYRISTDPDFKDAEWLVYSDVLQYSPISTDVGKGKLYFQLRKEIKASGGVMEAFSKVVSQPVNI